MFKQGETDKQHRPFDLQTISNQGISTPGHCTRTSPSAIFFCTKAQYAQSRPFNPNSIKSRSPQDVPSEILGARERQLKVSNMRGHAQRQSRANKFHTENRTRHRPLFRQFKNQRNSTRCLEQRVFLICNVVIRERNFFHHNLTTRPFQLRQIQDGMSNANGPTCDL